MRCAGCRIRLEVGPKDMEKEQVVLVRRDTHEKLFVPMAELEATVSKLLDDIHASMLQKALELRENRTTTAKDMDEFVSQLDGKQGFIRAMWCGDRACEDTIKEKTAATARCMPFDQTPVGDALRLLRQAGRQTCGVGKGILRIRCGSQ